MGKGKKSSKQDITPLFITKLCNMLEDQACSDYIDWTSTQDSFIIKDISKFTNQVLPKYFRHSNLSSFTRQLNMYGFSKLRHDQRDNVYSHKSFKRHSKNNLVRKIQRKANAVESQIGVYQSNKQINQEINKLKIRQNQLQDLCKQLIAQNQMHKNNKMMIQKLQDSEKVKDSKTVQLLASLVITLKNNQTKLSSQVNQSMISSIRNQSMRIQDQEKNRTKQHCQPKIQQNLSKDNEILSINDFQDYQDIQNYSDSLEHNENFFDL